ncbi:MAG: PQQ-binding-like beta-propeller repeat protein [bacterium]|nr:PQQ-binding-like beta-propeller repeat protein [bacterium]
MVKYRGIFLILLMVIVAGINGYPESPGASVRANRLFGKFNCGGPVRSTAAVFEETVYIGSDSGEVRALDRKTGRMAWVFRADGAVASRPAVQSHLVFFSSKTGTVYALHRREGKEAWRFTSKAVKFYQGGWDYFVSSPVVAGDLVIVGSGDNHIYALKWDTGALVWKFDTGAVVRATPALDNKKGTVYCGTMKGELYALNVKSGKVKWKFKTVGNKYFPKGELLFEPMVYKNTVYAGSRDASFYAVDGSDGSLRWKVSDSKGAWYTTAAVFGNTVFAASSDGHYVQALDPASGKEKWKFYADDLIFSTPAVHDGILYVGSHDGKLYAVDVGTGRLVWRFKLGNDVLGSALIDRDILMIGSDDGNFYTFRIGKWGAAAGEHRVVYWAPLLDVKITNANVHDTEKLYRFCHDAGYDVVGAAGLERFLTLRIGDGQASSSVIVLASAAFPYSIFQTRGNSPALVRQYLDAGGTFVSVGYPPFLYALRQGEDKLHMPYKEVMAALGFDRSFFFPGFFNYDAYISYPTDVGKRFGMPEWWSSGYGVDPGRVTVVLGKDEHGRATAWIKSYGGPEGTGLIRLWGNDQLPEDMTFIKKVAESAIKEK